MTIKNFSQLLTRYAQVVTKTGLNVRKGQSLLIYADLDQAPLVHRITDAAYDLGANRVDVEWSDLHTQREFLKHADEASLTTTPTWLSVRAQHIADTATTRVSIMSANPDGLSDIDGERISAYQTAMQHALSPVRKATMNNDLDWIVIAGASQAWAEKVFPELTGEAALDRLWQEIFKVNRIHLDEDPNQLWQAHIATLQEKADWLNQQQFKALHFQSPRTDLTVGLAEDHHWEAADSVDKSGHTFVANMPTEEVFTSPDRRFIDGHVTSTKPLSYAGVLITDIQLTFEKGRVVKVSATQGQNVLEKLLATDEGAKSLGEVSLVPDPSPISQSGITFYNTLFDENASDHLALGAAYPFNIKNGSQLDLETRMAKGQNDSLVHVDFMIGSADMDVDGLTADGQVVPVFRQGDWA